MRAGLAVSVVASLLAGPAAMAQDCDCARRVGLCQAEASYDGAVISFTSQTSECSRISFSVDDLEAAITIRHGKGAARLVSETGSRKAVSVEACYVCDVAKTR